MDLLVFVLSMEKRNSIAEHTYTHPRFIYEFSKFFSQKIVIAFKYLKDISHAKVERILFAIRL